MADSARIATDKTLEQMERELHAIYTRAHKEVGETWQAYMREAGEEIDALQKAYDAAKQSGDKAAIKSTGRKLGMKKREVTLQNTHYKNLTETLAQDISHVNERAIAYVNGKIPDIYALNYNSVANGVSDTVKGISFELVDASTIKNLATSDKTLLPYKKVNGRKDVRWNTQRVNAEVMQGILQGESMPKIATRLGNVLGMNEVSAIRNARTSVTSAENKGRMDMLHAAREKGVITHKIWLATGDNRTRDWHSNLDGVELEIDEPFENEIPTKGGSYRDSIMYPGDVDADPANVYNCRCSLIYKVVGFGASAGATNVDGDSIRYSDKMDGEKWDETKGLINSLAEQYNTKLQEVKPGSHLSAGSVQISGTIMHLSSASKDIALHEFAHTISIENQTKFGLYNESDFWREIKQVQRQYKKAVGYDSAKWISSYEHSSKGTDEFMAEAFTQAKAAELGIKLPPKYGKDLTYSDKVLRIIDKYFKRK